MKLLSGHKTKNIRYFGIDMTVRESVKFLATDEDGEVYGFDMKPTTKATFWHVSEYAYDFVADVDLEGMDWKDTLVELPVL